MKKYMRPAISASLALTLAMGYANAESIPSQSAEAVGAETASATYQYDGGKAQSFEVLSGGGE